MKFRTIMIIGIITAACCLGCGTKAKKVFYINSYHEGYGTSDEITRGIRSTLANSDVALEVFYMNTKRMISDEYIRDITIELVRAISITRPDLIIASDDNAVKYVIAPNFKEGPIPCVFCGVNWWVGHYGLPTWNITGIIEVQPISETISILEGYYPELRTITIITENSTEAEDSRRFMEGAFRDHGLKSEYRTVTTFRQWKKAFEEAQTEGNCVFIPANASISGWDEHEARSFVADTIQVPVFTCDEAMMQYAVFGLAKVAREQGVWAAQAALKILNGTSPSDIPVVRNEQVKTYYNPSLADKIGFSPEKSLVDPATIIH